MSSLLAHDSVVRPAGWRQLNTERRADALADRVEQGARTLAAFTGELTEVQWQTRVPRDGRTIGLIVHHVASVYPLEIQLAQRLAAGHPVIGVTRQDINERNATHAWLFVGVTKEATLDLLRRNSAAAALAIRALCDDHLDRAAPVSLYGDAPLTCQFVLEDRVVRHSYHHLATIQSALKAHDEALERLKRELGT
jgi:DinB family protein